MTSIRLHHLVFLQADPFVSIVDVVFYFYDGPSAYYFLDVSLDPFVAVFPHFSLFIKCLPMMFHILLGELSRGAFVKQV